MDPVEFRVAPPAADPPDNASDIGTVATVKSILFRERVRREETCTRELLPRLPKVSLR
jgi:hypothetical protein